MSWRQGPQNPSLRAAAALPLAALAHSRKAHILEHRAFQSLADEWALRITNTEVDDDILEHIGITRAEFDAMGAAPTWMDVVVNQAVGPWEIHGAALNTLRQFHMETSTQAVSHLKLAVSNIHRSTWALGGALLADADLAVQAVAAFLEHLDTIPPHARNKFEQAF